MDERELIKTVEKAIVTNNLICRDDTVLIGVSGGSDSICLVDILLKIKDKYGFRIFVVHVNHMLRGEESDADQEHVHNYCQDRNIEFYTKKVNVKEYAKKNGLSIELSARNLRYEIFNQFIKDNKADKIAVAHNKNDQVETALMRIMRGTGLDGLTAMDYCNNNIIRPLLDVKKECIDNYCINNKIDIVLDKTNKENIYTRNKIRNKIIPYLENEFHADIIDRIYNMVLLLKEDKRIINDLIKDIYQDLVTKKNAQNIFINITKLNKYADEIIKRIVKYALVDLKGDIIGFETVHINSVLKLIRDSKAGKSINLTNNVVAIVLYDSINLKIVNNNDIQKEFRVEVEIPGQVCIPEIGLIAKFAILDYDQTNLKLSREDPKSLIQYFDYEVFINENIISNNDINKTLESNITQLNSKIVIRSRKERDYIILSKFKGRKKIKEYFIDKKIPRYDRVKVPLLAFDSEIIWIIGYRTNTRYKVTDNSKKILKVSVFHC